MGKLYETLAVKRKLSNAAERAFEGVVNIFTNQGLLFVGVTKRYAPLDEEGTTLPPDDKPLGARVDDSITEFFESYLPYLDLEFQIESANTQATASVDVGEGDDRLLLEEMPATALLNLEKHLEKFRRVLSAVPTLDPSESWTEDADQVLYRSAPRDTLRHEQVETPVVLYEATKEHPAQVEVFKKQLPVGTWTTTKLSGEWPLARQRRVIRRLETLIIHVQQARKRANAAEAPSKQIGETIMDWLLTP